MKAIQFIGSSRSGANLLGLLMEQLPEIVAPNPLHLLDTFYPLLEYYPNINRDQNFRGLIQDVLTYVQTCSPEWQVDGITEARILNRCKRKTLPDIYFALYILLAEDQKSSFWCSRSMSNIHFLPALESSSIAPFYIHIVRDGRDVAASFRRTKEGEKHIYHLTQLWRKEQLIAQRFLWEIEEDRAVVIRFEDLIDHPLQVMESLCKRLSIPFDKEKIQNFLDEKVLITAESSPMFGQYSTPIFSDTIGKFKELLNDEEVEFFECLTKDLLRFYNYDFKPNNISISFTKQQLLTFEADNEKMKQGVALQEDHLDLIQRRIAQKRASEFIKKRFKVKG